MSYLYQMCMNNEDLTGEIANLAHSGTPGSGLIIITYTYMHVYYVDTHTQAREHVDMYAAQMHMVCASTLLAYGVRQQFLTCSNSQ